MDEIMALPGCVQHGQMTLQQSGTPEQKWCGVWYRCERCTNAVLLESEALRAQRAQAQQKGPQQ